MPKKLNFCKRRLKLNYLAVSLVCSLFSAEASASMIGDAVRQSLMTNPDVLSSVSQESAAEYDVREARGGYLPTVDIGAGIGKEYSDNPATRASLTHHSTFLTRKESDIFIRQLLFDGGNVSGTVAQRRYEQRRFGNLIQETRQRVAYEAANAYLEIVRRQQLVQVAREDVAAHKDMLDKIEKRLRAGAGRKSEVNLVKSRLSLAETRLERQKGFLADSRDTYVRVVGHEAPSHLPIPIMPRIPASVTAAQDLAMEVNPTVAALQSQYDANKAAVGVAKSTYYPTFNLDIAGNMSDSLDGVRGHNNDALAILRMEYNIFRGGSDKAAIEAAVERQIAAKYDIDNTRREVNQDVAFAWNDLQATRKQIPALRTHQAESWKVFEAYQKQFQLGQRTLFDLLNAQTEYFEAKANLVNGEYELRDSHYRLLASVGNIVDVLGFEDVEPVPVDEKLFEEMADVDLFDMNHDIEANQITPADSVASNETLTKLALQAETFANPLPAAEQTQPAFTQVAYNNPASQPQPAAAVSQQPVAAQPAAALSASQLAQQDVLQQAAAELAAMTPAQQIQHALLARNDQHYTLQLMATQDVQRVKEFVNNHHLQGKAAFYKTDIDGKTWYRIVYGDYASKEDALNAINNMPENLRDLTPVARSYASVKTSMQNIG